jgi:hypothetical protein
VGGSRDRTLDDGTGVRDAPGVRRPPPVLIGLLLLVLLIAAVLLVAGRRGDLGRGPGVEGLRAVAPVVAALPG